MAAEQAGVAFQQKRVAPLGEVVVAGHMDPPGCRANRRPRTSATARVRHHQGARSPLAIQPRPGAPATGQLFGMTPHQEQVIASEPYSGAWQVMAERRETP
jgi:hypothetical protein